MSNNTSSCQVPYIPMAGLAAAKAAAYLMIFAISVLGNVLIILVVGKNQRLRSAPINRFIVSMAVADILTTLFNMMIEICIYTREATGQRFVWFNGPGSNFLCKIIAFIQGISLASSVLTLTAIAVNRFFAVFFPLKMPGLSKPLTNFVIGLIWVVSCAIASPMLYAMKVVKKDCIVQCYERWSPAFDDKSSPKIYTLVLLVSLYIVPLSVMTVLYTAIVRKVWTRQVPGNIIAPNQLVELATKKRVLRMLITIVVVFALCWMPYYTYLLLIFLVHSSFHEIASVNVMFVGLFLGHANSAINPCIYAIFNKEYRSGFTNVNRAFLSSLNHASRVPLSHLNSSSLRRTQLPTAQMAKQEKRSPTLIRSS
ncbi:QRFP-like peptide receptor [Montipora capricornis]|uniref:QRFP-like peptide receptor n=1 Tax=Montipora capricornis TaxID=246305 RepID=UPI0035F1B9FC